MSKGKRPKTAKAEALMGRDHNKFDLGHKMNRKITRAKGVKGSIRVARSHSRPDLKQGHRD